MKRKIALALHGLTAVVFLALAVVYMTRTEIMPYHLDALGTTWDAIEPAYQTLFLAFIRGVGGGYLAAAVALFVIVLIPMRRGAAWARWAAPTIVGSGLGPLIGVIMYVRANTSAEPPLTLAVVVLAISIIAALIGPPPESD